jgi:hypothetical protein
VEQARFTLTQTSGGGRVATVAVAEQLLECGVHWIGSGGVTDFGFDYNQWDSIHKEYYIRDDAFLHVTWRVNAELVDGVEDVAFGMSEVDELHHRIALACDFVKVHLGFEEERLDCLVGFQQGAVWLAVNLGNQIVELAVGQPVGAVRSDVDGAHSIAEYLGEEPFAEGVAQTGRRVGGDKCLALVDDRPTESGELVEKRFFYVEIFGHGHLTNCSSQR